MVGDSQMVFFTLLSIMQKITPAISPCWLFAIKHILLFNIFRSMRSRLYILYPILLQQPARRVAGSKGIKWFQKRFRASS
jgi:hypothetical protein